MLVPVGGIPFDTANKERVEEIAPEAGRTVLAHGEVTGHAHAFKEPVPFYREKASGRRFLKLVEPQALSHEEHAPIEVPPGNYEVIRQTEFDERGRTAVLD